VTCGRNVHKNRRSSIFDHIILVTLVFSSAALKVKYFVEHTSLVLVSTPGRSVNCAIEMTILLFIN